YPSRCRRDSAIIRVFSAFQPAGCGTLPKIHPVRNPMSLRRCSLSAVMVLACSGLVFGQGRAQQAPRPQFNLSDNPLLRPFTFRSIGPATMMGRVDDIEGSPQDPMTIYVGFATGGLWKSTDGGATGPRCGTPCRTSPLARSGSPLRTRTLSTSAAAKRTIAKAHQSARGCG